MNKDNECFNFQNPTQLISIEAKKLLDLTIHEKDSMLISEENAFFFILHALT